MRARDRDVPGADFGLEHGVVAIGGVLPDPAAAAALDAAVRAASDRDGPKAGRMLRRFAGLPDGALVWTRDSGGGYHLGRVAGPWRYDEPAAQAVGLGHTRPADWRRGPLGEGDVPPAVAESFARGGRNLQRIHGEHAERRTAELWR
jgi:predicted Mrr-cat superfamily restriction endonuclease